MATSPDHLYTFDEYLSLEAAAEYKSEFGRGKILAMSGGTLVHSRLSSRMNAVLDRHLAGCEVYDSNLKLYIEEFQRAVYPDCMALCGRPQFWKDREDVIVNPTVIVEVLSLSTEEYDRGAKVLCYRSIPSVEHILLVSQNDRRIEHYARKLQDKNWTVTQHVGEGRIPLRWSEITSDEIYGGIV